MTVGAPATKALLRGGSCLALSLCSVAATAQRSAPPVYVPDEILVIGQRPGSGLRADRQIDENGIASYGVDTVGDLINAIASETDASGEGPVILINGQPTNGIDDVSDLPTEAASRIQLLSRDAAAALGERPTRRVINVVIRPDHRQLTLNAKARLATAGQGEQAEGEVNLLRLDQGNRRSVVLRVAATDQLFESDRRIDSDIGPVPYALAGNILPYPLPGAQIDPALSLLAGQPVLVAAVPLGITNPALADFAATAGRANQSDLGRFRTLLPASTVASANANFTQKFGRSLVSLTVRGEQLHSRSRSGPATAALRLAQGSPFSPFSRDVTLATILADPLRQASRSTALTAAAIAGGPIGTWRYSIGANLHWRDARSDSDRGNDLVAYQAALDSGAANPFGPIPAALLGAAFRDRSRSRSTDLAAFALLNGSPFTLPAGPARASVRIEWHGNRARSSIDDLGPGSSRRLHRNQSAGQATLQLPLVNSKPLGAIGVEFSGALRHVTAGGALHDTGYALNWQPDERLSLRAAVNHEQLAPPATALSDLVVITDNVRTYDFIRQETVLVRYVTGGNPDIGIERRRTITIGGSWRPFDSIDLDLSADYVNFTGRGAFAALPPVNGDVQAAFPDRFQRDSDGRLIAVDARPVSFARVHREEVRGGIAFSRSFGASALRPVVEASDRKGDDPGSGWRVNGFINHQWTLRSQRLARRGLPTIDLLDGGALGYGGGQPRHRLQFGGGVVHRGVGLQLDGDWVAASQVAAGTLLAPDRLTFASRLLVDARLFANLGPLLPDRRWARGLRLSLSVDNAFDSSQRVRDEAGATPLGYQRYLLDPLGRTISLSLRKVFQPARLD